METRMIGHWKVSTDLVCTDNDFVETAVKQYNVKVRYWQTNSRRSYVDQLYICHTRSKLKIMLDDYRGNIFVDEMLIWDDFNNSQRWERLNRDEMESLRMQIAGEMTFEPNLHAAPKKTQDWWANARLNREIQKALKCDLGDYQSGRFDVSNGYTHYELQVHHDGSWELKTNKGKILKRSKGNETLETSQDEE